MPKNLLALTHLHKPPGMTPRQQHMGTKRIHLPKTCCVICPHTCMSQTLTTAASVAATASSVRICFGAASCFAGLHKQLQMLGLYECTRSASCKLLTAVMLSHPSSLLIAWSGA